MELHLHLSVAFRALDRKWGKPVDLESTEDLTTCIPAIVDIPTTTFSSEEFLQARRQKRSLKVDEQNMGNANDTFADISCARIPSVCNESGVEESSGCSEESITYSNEEEVSRTEFDSDLVRSVERHFEQCEADCTAILESRLDSNKWGNVFRLFKNRAKFLIEKCKKNSENATRG
ncbi:hypothetical protein HF086_014561 [Spodoptera exigua]|uniref:Uncharacterized protein n=1 Tax=Spodoptera exigua TaxID=7107 RepID=A0A922M459_SPOEX|nr:hypothetical protein HF086_014561 [Spodoptera exigua]